MTVFIIGAVVTVVLALALLLRPFLRISGSAQTSHRQLNAAILREQLAKLDQDLAEGTLRQEDFNQARADLQRRVLDDTREEDAVPTLRAPRRTLVSIALMLPVAAVAVYFTIGNPDGLGAGGGGSVAQRATEQDIERMVQTLADRLAKEPGNLKGWAMLARSYKVMGRSVEAEQAFERAGAFIDDDAQLLADYADVAATNANGSFAGKPSALIDRALKADPNHVMTLWLAGTAALDRKEYDRALVHWERLSRLLPPGSQDAQTIQSSIDQVRVLAGKGGSAPKMALADAKTQANTTSGANATPQASANPGASVSGTVELAPALKAQAAPDDTVMVIARVPGTRMPVAVLRVRASDLPLKFTLDDSLAMSPQARISAASEVDVEARISRSGLAKPEPGDLISSVQTVKVGSRDVALRVAQVRN